MASLLIPFKAVIKVSARLFKKRSDDSLRMAEEGRADGQTSDPNHNATTDAIAIRNYITSYNQDPPQQTASGNNTAEWERQILQIQQLHQQQQQQKQEPQQERQKEVRPQPITPRRRQPGTPDSWHAEALDPIELMEMGLWQPERVFGRYGTVHGVARAQEERQDQLSMWWEEETSRRQMEGDH